MAFKPRKNKENVFEDSFEISSNVETSEKDNTQEKVESSKKIAIKKYEEMTIEVLNILEKQGINIYDKNRTPGMYLNRRRKNDVATKNIIEKLSEENKPFEDIRKDSDNKNNIIAFLLKNK